MSCRHHIYMCSAQTEPFSEETRSFFEIVCRWIVDVKYEESEEVNC